MRALYWSELLCNQNDDPDLADSFKEVFSYLKLNEDAINKELIQAQSQEQDINGYYLTDIELTKKAMCPSSLLNKIFSEA